MQALFGLLLIFICNLSIFQRDNFRFYVLQKSQTLISFKMFVLICCHLLLLFFRADAEL